MNSLLSTIRQQCHDLTYYLLCASFPDKLTQAARELQDYRVPLEWIHANRLPGLRDLHSWQEGYTNINMCRCLSLTHQCIIISSPRACILRHIKSVLNEIDLKDRHDQMKEWLHSQMVPVFTSRVHTTTCNQTTTVRSYGRLVGVWLGGLANPAALVTSFSLEVALMSGDITSEVQII